MEQKCPNCNNELTPDDFFRGMCLKCKHFIPGEIEEEYRKQRKEQKRKEEERNKEEKEKESEYKKSVVKEWKDSTKQFHESHFVNPKSDVSENPDILLGFLSFLLPPIGLIMGLVYVTKTKAKDKATARICFGWAIVGLLLGIIIVSVNMS